MRGDPRDAGPSPCVSTFTGCRVYCLKLSTQKIYHFSSIYLFFQSFLYINMDSYLFYTLGYNPVYFFINFVPYFFLVLGTINSRNGLPCPFDVSPSLCVYVRVCVCVCVCESVEAHLV